MTTAIIISYALIVLFLADCWSVAVVWKLWRGNLDVVELRRQRNRLGLTAAAAFFAAVIALNFLTGMKLLPAGTGFFLLVAAVITMSGPCLYFLLTYYIRQ